MSWKHLFGFSKKKKGPDPLHELNLSDIQKGYLIDFDLKTWEIEAAHYYDWGNGDISHEWQLKSHDETIYLEKESDDEDEWSVSRTISFSLLGADLRNYIQANDDAPDKIVFEGINYHLESFGGGYFYRNGQKPGQEFLGWNYRDDSGEKYLSIEQWGDDEFEASIGQPVEEYQFTNILPREKS